MIEIKYETLKKKVTTRIQDDNMYWKELVEHFINLLPSMGYNGINTEDIILVLHKYLDSTGDIRQESSDKPIGTNSNWRWRDVYDTPEPAPEDTPELTPHNYNMNWNREEVDIPDEHDDEDIQTIYTDMITDEEDY